MSGALLQLSAIGSQDFYLTGNPEITFFKNNYKRYTNFAIETVQTNFQGTVSFGSNINTNVKIVGDLISGLTLVLKLKENNLKKWGYVKKLGNAIIDEISISVDNVEIDKINGES